MSRACQQQWMARCASNSCQMRRPDVCETGSVGCHQSGGLLCCAVLHRCFSAQQHARTGASSNGAPCRSAGAAGRPVGVLLNMLGSTPARPGTPDAGGVAELAAFGYAPAAAAGALAACGGDVDAALARLFWQLTGQGRPGEGPGCLECTASSPAGHGGNVCLSIPGPALDGSRASSVKQQACGVQVPLQLH